MRRSPRRIESLGVVVALLLLATACTAGDATEAGFPQPGRTLTIGVGDSPGRYSYEVTEEFARRVTEKAGGSLSLQVRNIDTRRPRWNQEFIAQVQSGALDLLVVQGQAWDTVGVDTFTALYVPFLVSDEEHLDAVTTSDLVDDMLAGLEGTGVTGLGIVPGGMRRLFNDTQAPLRPADIAGDGVRVAYSETIWKLFEGVGARPDDPNGEDVTAAFRDGRVSHLDSTFPLSDGFLTSPKAAADVPIYPLAFTIVGGDKVLAELATAQLDLLRSTAREVAQWAADTRTSEAEDARALCARNPRAQVVRAGDSAAAEWRAATSGLAAELRSDPVVDDLAERIERIGADLATPAQPVQPCSGAGSGQAAPTSANVPDTFPEGTYRKEVTAQALIDRGVNPAVAHEHADVWTLTFRGGVLGDPDDPGCPGSTYAIVDERVVLTLGPEGPECGTAAGQVLFSAGWRLDGTQLTFTDVRSGHGNDVLTASLFGGEPWTRIG